MTPDLLIKRVPTTDAAQLLELSRRTFFDAFAHLNSVGNMEAFAANAFTLASFEQQLNNPYAHFYYAYADGDIAGYIKLNYSHAQTELQDPESLEVERIYVLQQYQGQKIGAQLLDFAIQTAKQEQMRYIWLGVWEHNEGAIRFYERKGFTLFGSHPFMLGDEKQTDLLMKRFL